MDALPSQSPPCSSPEGGKGSHRQAVSNPVLDTRPCEAESATLADGLSSPTAASAAKAQQLQVSDQTLGYCTTAREGAYVHCGPPCLTAAITLASSLEGQATAPASVQLKLEPLENSKPLDRRLLPGAACFSTDSPLEQASLEAVGIELLESPKARKLSSGPLLRFPRVNVHGMLEVVAEEDDYDAEEEEEEETEQGRSGCN